MDKKVTLTEDNIRGFVEEYKVLPIETLKRMIKMLEEKEEFETCMIINAAINEKETGVMTEFKFR